VFRHARIARPPAWPKDNHHVAVYQAEALVVGHLLLDFTSAGLGLGLLT
jgi:hypothetical protein